MKDLWCEHDGKTVHIGASFDMTSPDERSKASTMLEIIRMMATGETEVTAVGAVAGFAAICQLLAARATGAVENLEEDATK